MFTSDVCLGVYLMCVGVYVCVGWVLLRIVLLSPALTAFRNMALEPIPEEFYATLFGSPIFLSAWV